MSVLPPALGRRALALLPALFPILLAACDGDQTVASDSPNVPVLSDSAGVEVLEYAAFPGGPGFGWVLERDPLLSVGLIDGDDPYLFSRVGDVYLREDGSLVVVENDAEEVRIFDAAGAFVRRFGGAGDGPGEFQATSQSRLIGDTIEIWDAITDRITAYTLSGQFIRTEHLEVPGESRRVAGLFPDGGFLVETGGVTGRVPDGKVEVIQAQTRWGPERPDHLDTLALTATGMYSNAGVMMTLPFNASGAEALTEDAFYLAPGGRLEYRRYGLDGSLRRIVRGGEEPLPVDAASRAAYLDQQRRNFEQLRSAEISANTDILERALSVLSDAPTAESFPMVDQIVVDDGRRIWIRRYVSEYSDQDNQTWLVFDTSDAPAGSLTLPRNLTVKAVYGDRIVGVWRDELGVQTVRVYGIDRS
jgi:hypothetical protein